MQTPNAAVAAIQFALETDEGLAFLRCWNEGNFEAIRREWPEAPEAVFIGADPLHPATVAQMQTDPVQTIKEYRAKTGASLATARRELGF